MYKIHTKIFHKNIHITFLGYWHTYCKIFAKIINTPSIFFILLTYKVQYCIVTITQPPHTYMMHIVHCTQSENSNYKQLLHLYNNNKQHRRVHNIGKYKKKITFSWCCFLFHDLCSKCSKSVYMTMIVRCVQMYLHWILLWLVLFINFIQILIWKYSYTY